MALLLLNPYRENAVRASGASGGGGAGQLARISWRDLLLHLFSSSSFVFFFVFPYASFLFDLWLQELRAKIEAIEKGTPPPAPAIPQVGNDA